MARKLTNTVTMNRSRGLQNTLVIVNERAIVLSVSLFSYRRRDFTDRLMIDSGCKVMTRGQTVLCMLFKWFCCLTILPGVRSK